MPRMRMRMMTTTAARIGDAAPPPPPRPRRTVNACWRSSVLPSSSSSGGSFASPSSQSIIISGRGGLRAAGRLSILSSSSPGPDHRPVSRHPSIRPYAAVASSPTSADGRRPSSPSSSSSHPRPAPPMVPAAPSASRSLVLVPPPVLESLRTLPECRHAMDLLDGGPYDIGADGMTTTTNTTTTAAAMGEALAGLARARDVLSSARAHDLANATLLLESDLFSYCGEYGKALDCLTGYARGLPSTVGMTGKNDHRRERRTALQFEKARLLACSGRLVEALSEYEDLLERMERETEDRMAGGNMMGHDDDDDDGPLPVIHGAAALTGVGAAKLLLRLREGDAVVAEVDDDEVFESLETATEVLLESRREALLSPLHYQLAVDLGLAASISLTNSGVAHCLLRRNDDDDDDDGHRRRALELWTEGLATLDSILADAANSLVVIPRHKFVCMESVRARLYCSISWTLLGFRSLPSPSTPETLKSNGVSDETLRGASDAAKRALDIYDELMNGPKFMRESGADEDDDGRRSGDETAGEDGTTGQEWEEILRDSATEERGGDGHPTTRKPTETPLSPLWFAYHKCESARALGLVARCYALAGSAVTAEGLFQSSMDASSSHPFGRKVRPGNSGPRGERVERGVSLSSPNLGLIARDVRSWYAMLCDDWEKRGGDAARLRSDAAKIEDDGVLKGYVRDKDGVKRSVSGLESSLWLFSPLNFQ